MSTNDGRTQGDGLASYDLATTAIDWRRLAARLAEIERRYDTLDARRVEIERRYDAAWLGSPSLSAPTNADAPPSDASDANRANRQGDDGTAGEAGAAGTARTGGRSKSV